MRLIDADLFIKEQIALYCEKCERRMGMKNGKKKFVYKIGDAPCRACEVMDMIDDVENAPTVEINTVEPIKRLIAKYEKSIECIEESMNDLDNEGGAVYGNLCALKEIYESVIADLRGENNNETDN